MEEFDSNRETFELEIPLNSIAPSKKHCDVLLDWVNKGLMDIGNTDIILDYRNTL